jgi:hypothetical protein
MRVVFELDDSIPEDALRYNILKNAVEANEILREIFRVSTEIVESNNSMKLTTEQYAQNVRSVIAKLNM